jgi:predicted phage-related endonuclease
MHWGFDVEEGIARAYERLTGRMLHRPGYSLLRHEEYPELFCTPDALCRSEPRLVQLKWSRRQDGWGDPGSDEIPDVYRLQCVMEMACANWDLEDVAAMIIGPPIAVYPLHRDLEFEREVIDAAREWWDSYVVKGVEPPVQGTQPWGAYLSRKFPLNTGEWLEAAEGSELKSLVDSFRAARENADHARESEEALKNQLKAQIGERDGIRWKDGRISWRREKDHHEDVTDWATLFMTLCGELKVPIERQQQLKDIYTEFGVVTREGQRKFVLREDR